MNWKKCSPEAAPIPPRPTPLFRRACWLHSFPDRSAAGTHPFFVDLPSQTEREQIFSIQVAKRKRNPVEFDLERLAEAAWGYSGAEIDAAIQGCLYASYSGKKLLATQSLLDALAHTVPLSTTRAEEIEALRDWASTRAIPASARNTEAKPAALPRH